jgi:hypothetical protein
MVDGRRRHPWVAAVLGSVLILAAGFLVLSGLLRGLDADWGPLGYSEGDPRYLMLAYAGIGVFAAIPFLVARISGHRQWVSQGVLAFPAMVIAAVVTWPLAFALSNFLAPMSLGFVVGGAVALRHPPVAVLPWRAGALLVLVIAMFVDDVQSGIFGAGWTPALTFLLGLPLIAAADALAARAVHRTPAGSPPPPSRAASVREGR